MGPARFRIRRRQLVAIVTAAVVTAPIFNVLTSAASVAEAVQGLVDAVLISLLVGGYLLFVRDDTLRPWLQRVTFRASFALNSAIVLALFLGGRALGKVITTGEPRRFLTSFTEAHLLYAIPFFVAFAIAIEFVLQMNRLIGANVLGYFVAGVYHRPTMETRVFLFLDLVGSTQHAERLGSARYFGLLRRFVDDLTGPVIETEGEIYQYAGDEVVVTWPIAGAVREANCVRCWLLMRDAIAGEAARYERDFGVVPRFRGGLHGGTVTAGELGDLRRQIVFVGDILNTAARLEEYAKRADLDLVISGELLDQLALPPGVTATHCGELALRGKDAPVAAYALTRPSAGLPRA